MKFSKAISVIFILSFFTLRIYSQQEIKVFDTEKKTKKKSEAFIGLNLGYSISNIYSPSFLRELLPLVNLKLPPSIFFGEDRIDPLRKHTGIALGIPFKIAIDKIVYLKSGIFYHQFGFSGSTYLIDTSNQYNFNKSVEIDGSFHQLTNPLLLGFKTKSKFYFMAELGFLYSRLLKSTISIPKLNYVSNEGKYFYNERIYKTFSAGLGFSVSKRFAIEFAYSYYKHFNRYRGNRKSFDYRVNNYSGSLLYRL